MEVLLRYELHNFKSFADAAFSLEAPKNKIKRRFPDSFTSALDGVDVLKEAFIVGENAGGKTNFVESVGYLQSLFKTTDKPVMQPSTVNEALKGRPGGNFQEFNFELVLDGEVFRYELMLDAKGINEERLTKRAGLGFVDCFHIYYVDAEGGYRTRINEQLDSSKAIRKGKVSEQVLDNIGLGLSIVKLAILGYEGPTKVVNWMTRSLVVEKGCQPSRLLDEALGILETPEYFDIFRLVDTSIVRLEVDKRSPFSESRITRAFEDGRTFTRTESEDSSGVQEFMRWALLVYQVVHESKTVFADEVDRVMNPVLADRVIAYLNGMDHAGQFVFTTHNIMHLSLKTYMKEQIYFATKDRETLVSSLYSLSEFDDIRYDVKTEVYEFYMRGVLGGTAYE